MTKRHIIAIGGSDAGISAALRARELDPATEVSVIVADAYPNFSICGIPYYISSEVGHWSNLAHRTAADLAATGMRVLTDTRVVRINADERTADVLEATGTPNPTAIFHAMTVDGMNELDLSYHPTARITMGRNPSRSPGLGSRVSVLRGGCELMGVEGEVQAA